MNPRYYVFFVQFNKNAQAENRTVPNAYDSLNKAKQRFHDQMAKDMNNDTLGWSIGYILDNFTNKIQSELYIADDFLPPEPEEPEEEETPQEENP